MTKAIYVTVDESYTATVRSIEDIQYYCKWAKINPSTLVVESDDNNKKLGKEVAIWIESFKKPIVKKIMNVGKLHDSFGGRAMSVSLYSISYAGKAVEIESWSPISLIRQNAKRIINGCAVFTCNTYLKK